MSIRKREKKVSGEGNGVHTRGEGLGTGPVGTGSVGVGAAGAGAAGGGLSGVVIVLISIAAVLACTLVVLTVILAVRKNKEGEVVADVIDSSIEVTELPDIQNSDDETELADVTDEKVADSDNSEMTDDEILEFADKAYSEFMFHLNVDADWKDEIVIDNYRYYKMTKYTAKSLRERFENYFSSQMVDSLMDFYHVEGDVVYRENKYKYLDGYNAGEPTKVIRESDDKIIVVFSYEMLDYGADGEYVSGIEEVEYDLIKENGKWVFDTFYLPSRIKK